MRMTLMVARMGIELYDWIFQMKYTQVPVHRISASKLPWLFVGVELFDGTIVDKTSHAQLLVDMNITVTRSMICMGTPSQQIKRCFYLCEKTLKEEEIPTEGITINDS
jgi:hypothetical protein